MDNTWNSILLVFNALIWVVTFGIYQYKRRYFGMGSAILLLYTGIAVVSPFLFYNPYAAGLFTDLSLLPYLYLYFMILLALFPILRMNEKKIKAIQPPSQIIFNTVCIALILFSMYDIGNIVSDTREGLVMMFLDDEYSLKAYQETSAKFIRGKIDNSINVLGVMRNLSRSIVPIFMLYYLTLRKQNIFISIGLIFTAILAPLTHISTGTRGGLVTFVLETGCMFLFIRKFYPAVWQRRIKTFAVIICMMMIVPLSVVTLSRAQGDYNRAFATVERYYSESFLRFNNYGLDPNGCRYGDKTFPLVKQVAGMDPARDYLTRVSKYSHMSMDESVFYTFVGDFTLDFGPIITIFIFLGTCFFFLHTLKVRSDGQITFYQVLALYTLMCGCIGFFQFPFSDISGNIKLFALLFLILAFKFDHDLHKQNRLKI